ncbi:hypothetical protein D3C72_2476360 [compost metagenome]
MAFLNWRAVFSSRTRVTWSPAAAWMPIRLTAVEPPSTRKIAITTAKAASNLPRSELNMGRVLFRQEIHLPGRGRVT